MKKNTFFGTCVTLT